MKKLISQYWPFIGMVIFFGSMIAYDAYTGNISTGSGHGFPWYVVKSDSAR